MKLGLALALLFCGTSLHARTWADARVEFNQAFQDSMAAKPACNTFQAEFKAHSEQNDVASFIQLAQKLPPLPPGTVKAWEIMMKDDFPPSIIEARILLDKLQQVTVCETPQLVAATRTVAHQASPLQKKEYAQAVLNFIKSETLKPNAMITYMTYLGTLKALAEENLLAKKWLPEITALRTLAKKEEDFFFTRLQEAHKSHDALQGLQVVRQQLTKVLELESGLQKKILNKIK